MKVKMNNNNNNNNNCNIALIPEEKLEHLLRICREAAGGEHWREKMQALEQLSSRSHAYSISRSSSVLLEPSKMEENTCKIYRVFS